MNKRKIKYIISTCLSLALVTSFTARTVNVKAAEKGGKIFTIIGEKGAARLAGKDRFETSIKIADRFKSENDGKIDNVIIASAYGYADRKSVV